MNKIHVGLVKFRVLNLGIIAYVNFLVLELLQKKKKGGNSKANIE